MGHTTDVHIQRRGRTAKEADIARDVRLDYIGCTTSDFQYLLPGWRAARRHLVGLVVETVVTKQMSRRLKAARPGHAASHGFTVSQPASRGQVVI